MAAGTNNPIFLAAQQHHRAGRLAVAEQLYQQLIKAVPEHAAGLHNLGVLYAQMNNLPGAIESLARAARCRPDAAEIQADLGLTLVRASRLEEGMAALRRAVELNPDHADAWSNLAVGHRMLGLLDEAMHCYDRAVAVRPSFSEADSSRVYATHLDPASTPQSILAAHRQWNARHAATLTAAAAPFTPEPCSDRQLRIGYVSADLHAHPVGRFMLPLLQDHDRERFHVTIYSSRVAPPDEITQLIRQNVDRWLDIRGMSDADAADLIRSQGIDILVDLSMHTAHNRLLVFARKPAPIQVTYLAYCSTTGLDAMDYRLSDPYLDPPGPGDASYSERTIRLDAPYWCYPVPQQAPEVNCLPALSRGYITFACLNHFNKASPVAVAMWADVLRRVPSSRFTMLCKQPLARERISALFASHRVDPQRITFAGIVPLEHYFSSYHDFDIALDPFPWGGGTTSCDTLWMGVPLVTRAGSTAPSRGGSSLLSHLGLTDLIAHDARQYVDIAEKLAADLDRLSALRSTLRQRMRSSPLMDTKRFIHTIEAAFTDMWREWCGRQPPPSSEVRPKE